MDPKKDAKDAPKPAAAPLQKFAVVARHAAYEGKKSGTYAAASADDAFKAFLQEARLSVGTNEARVRAFEQWASGKTAADVDCRPVG